MSLRDLAELFGEICEQATGAIACDAAMAPVVTGPRSRRPGDLVRLCVELDSHRRAGTPDTSQAWEALERAVIGKTISVLMH